MILRYKGYFGSINKEQDICWGKCLMISDVVIYEAESEEGLIKEFKLAVEDYLLTCEEVGKVADIVNIVDVD